MKSILNFLCWWSYKIKGWKFEKNIPADSKRFVLIAAPHTSNWDAYYALTSFHIMKVPVRFTIKKEWLRWPFKRMMIKLGAIGIDRNPVKGEKKISTVDAMINLFNQHKDLIICITPEGTRSKMENWKTGFYHVATQAKVPIALGYIDYKNKMTGISKLFFPTGNMELDMKEIMNFYRKVSAKFPDNYSIDTRYA